MSSNADADISFQYFHFLCFLKRALDIKSMSLLPAAIEYAAVIQRAIYAALVLRAEVNTLPSLMTKLATPRVDTRLATHADISPRGMPFTR